MNEKSKKEGKKFFFPKKDATEFISIKSTNNLAEKPIAVISTNLTLISDRIPDSKIKKFIKKTNIATAETALRP